MKIHIARVENFYKKNGVAALFLEAGGLSAGQTILITGPTTGAVRMEVAAMRRETAEGMEPVEAVQKGETVYLAVPEQVRRRDKVYLLRPGCWRMPECPVVPFFLCLLFPKTGNRRQDDFNFAVSCPAGPAGRPASAGGAG